MCIRVRVYRCIQVAAHPRVSTSVHRPILSTLCCIRTRSDSRALRDFRGDASIGEEPSPPATATTGTGARAAWPKFQPYGYIVDFSTDLFATEIF